MSVTPYKVDNVRAASCRTVERKTNCLYQTSTMTALLSAVYDGERPWRRAMSKLGIVGATALSLALAIETPAFAAGLHGIPGGSAKYVGGGGFRGAASVGPVDCRCRERVEQR